MPVELAYDTPPEWAVRAGERPLELLSGAARTRREALLSATPGDRRLASLYAELCPSKAGHARLFVDLARERFPGPLVEDRLADLVRLEAGVIQGLPFAPRVHSGLVGVGAQGIGGDGRKEGVDAPRVFDP